MNTIKCKLTFVGPRILSDFSMHQQTKLIEKHKLGKALLSQLFRSVNRQYRLGGADGQISQVRMERHTGHGAQTLPQEPVVVFNGAQLLAVDAQKVYGGVGGSARHDRFGRVNLHAAQATTIIGR